MFKQAGLILGLVVTITFVFIASSYGDTLWYNGDFDGYDGLLNTVNSSWAQENVYDDFVVGGSGWHVNSVWSNNLMDYYNVTQASWEIRSGISHGNGGTIVASGISSATQTLTGRSGFNYNEYTIKVSGLNVDLAPGTYWLTVAPVGFGSGASFNSTTGGLNAIGTPAGNDAQAYFNDQNSNFDQVGIDIWTNFPTTSRDFSMGVGSEENSAVPEPTTMVLFGLGSLAMAAIKRNRKT